ncbi:MAG TPA: hypothetical protein VK123_02635 [Candidatus Limnocylindrales bacterium]|nr:hypothetical protein [Candidatus Limnocylindrales bacterium]
MAPQTGFWDRMQDQVRTGYERTRRTTARAMRIGILRVDLLSLRRDRTRAMAQFGERAFSRWNEGSLATFDDDPEAIRLRSLVEGIERCIRSKETELEQLRNEETRFSESDSGGQRPPQTEGTNGIS